MLALFRIEIPNLLHRLWSNFFRCYDGTGRWTWSFLIFFISVFRFPANGGNFQDFQEQLLPSRPSWVFDEFRSRFQRMKDFTNFQSINNPQNVLAMRVLFPFQCQSTNNNSGYTENAGRNVFRLLFFFLVHCQLVMWEVSTLKVADRLKLYLIYTPVLYFELPLYEYLSTTRSHAQRRRDRLRLCCTLGRM